MSIFGYINYLHTSLMGMFEVSHLTHLSHVSHVTQGRGEVAPSEAIDISPINPRGQPG